MKNEHKSMVLNIMGRESNSKSKNNIKMSNNSTPNLHATMDGQN